MEQEYTSSHAGSRLEVATTCMGAHRFRLDQYPRRRCCLALVSLEWCPQWRQRGWFRYGSFLRNAHRLGYSECDFWMTRANIFLTFREDFHHAKICLLPVEEVYSFSAFHSSLTAFLSS